MNSIARLSIYIERYVYFYKEKRLNDFFSYRTGQIRFCYMAALIQILYILYLHVKIITTTDTYYHG